jgi:hypothetical protein
MAAFASAELEGVIYESCASDCSGRIRGGFQSSESIIEGVGDEYHGRDKDKKKVLMLAEQPKELVIKEEEFARLLKVSDRGGSTISTVLREFYDSPLVQRSTCKGSGLKSTKPRIGMITHITPTDLRKSFSKEDVSNGLANRILWVATRRVASIPRPPRIDWQGSKNKPIVETLSEALAHNDENVGRELIYREAAGKLWDKYYFELDAASDGKTGVLGAIVARWKPILLRLAIIYAALDNSQYLEVHHLEAARAVWDYCQESACWAFGQKSGHWIADKSLALAKRAAPKGISETYINDNLGKRISAHDIDEALSELMNSGVMAPQKEEKKGPGRKKTLWFYVG